MARVAFFTETLPPDSDPISDFSFELMRGLAEQQHDLRIISTYRPGRDLPKFPQRIGAIFPFRRWNWLEVPRVLPYLFQFQPEILHIIQPRREALSGVTNAMTAIASLPPMIGKPALVTSFYDLRESDLRKYRTLLSLSSAITVSTRPQLQLMNDWFARMGRKSRTTLVPIPGITSETAHELDESSLPVIIAGTGLSDSIERFLANFARLVLVPGSVSAHNRLPELFSVLAETTARVENTGVIFGGGWGEVNTIQRRALMHAFEDRGVGANVLIAGDLDLANEEALLRRSTLVFLASLPFESLHLARLERQALRAGAVLLMNFDQAKEDILSWRDRETALITGQDAHEWGATLTMALTDEHLTDAIRRRIPDFARRETIDQPGNVVSRIYADVLGAHR
jgi:hypothetical protein